MATVPKAGADVTASMPAPPSAVDAHSASKRSSVGAEPASASAKPPPSLTPPLEALLSAAAKEAEKAAAAAATATATAAAVQRKGPPSAASAAQAVAATAPGSASTSTASATVAAGRGKEGEASAPKKRKSAEEVPEVELSTPALGDLAALDPRIAGMLKDRPEILQFLTKHPQVLKNMNADGISFLTRNLRNTKKPKTSKEEGLVAGRTLVLQNLHPNATEREVLELLDMSDLSPAEVTIPRESRKQRSCGVAYAVLRSTAAARSALRILEGATLRGLELHVELVDGKRSVVMPDPVDLEFVDIDAEEAAARDKPPSHNRRVKWKCDEELWEVALYDRNESVADFGSKILSHANQAPEAGVALLQGDSAQFQAAAKSEREQERKLVREALAHQQS